MTLSFLQTRARALAAGIACLLSLASALWLPGESRAHPHHDTPPTAPLLVRVLPQEEERAQLLVRHLHNNAATRSAEALLVGRPNHPSELSDHAHGRPAQLALGGTDLFLILAEGAPAPGPSHDALERAILSTFTPGDRIALQLGTTGPHLPLSGDLDLLIAHLSAAAATDSPDTERPAGESAEALIRATLEGTPPDEVRQHRELMLVADATITGGDLDALTRQLEAREIPLHILLIDDAPSATREHLCAIAHGSGGSCRVVPNEDAPNAMRQIMAITRSVFLSTLPCSHGDLPDPYPLLVQTSAGSFGPVNIDADRLRCPAPEAEVPVEQQVEAASGDLADVRDYRPLWLGLILALLLGVFLLLGKLAAGGQPIPPRPGSGSNSGSGRSREPNLLELPRNDNAVALISEEVSEERPAWLRDPALADAREALRRTRPSLSEPHVAFATAAGEVREVPLRGDALQLGAGSDVPLPGAGELRVQLRRRSDGWRFRAEGGALRHEEKEATSGLLRVGEELCVRDAFVLEFRPGRPEAALRGHLRTLPPGIFADEAASATGLLYGRDPQRYAGIEPRPASRVIGALSNDHLEVWRSGARLFARDLGSSNGSAHNGVRMEALVTTELQAGDRLELASMITLEVS